MTEKAQKRKATAVKGMVLIRPPILRMSAVGGVDDDAGAEEEAALGQAVHQDVEQRAGDAHGVHDGEAEEDEADLADRGVGDDALEVGLHGGGRGRRPGWRRRR